MSVPIKPKLTHHAASVALGLALGIFGFGGYTEDILKRDYPVCTEQGRMIRGAESKLKSLSCNLPPTTPRKESDQPSCFQSCNFMKVNSSV